MKKSSANALTKKTVSGKISIYSYPYAQKSVQSSDSNGRGLTQVGASRRATALEKEQNLKQSEVLL